MCDAFNLYLMFTLKTLVLDIFLKTFYEEKNDSFLYFLLKWCQNFPKLIIINNYLNDTC